MKDKNWISIDERVPEKIKKYPVLLNQVHEYMGTWHPGRECFVDIGLMIDLDEVTHWKDRK